MKKDRNRDYATDAFLLYANLGSPKTDDYIDFLKSCVYDECETMEPRLILQNAERTVSEHRPTISDIDAVNRMLEMLDMQQKDYISNAIRAVYMRKQPRAPSKGEISDRVRYYAQSLGADERTVYRWLRMGRELFAVCRGLRVD